MPLRYGAGSRGRQPSTARRRDPEQLGHVGDEREVAEQERREAGHALDAELGGDACEPARVRGQARDPRVEHPPPQRPRQPSLERDAEGEERERQQAALVHRRHPRAGVLRHQRDAGQAAREQGRERPAGDDRPGADRAQVLRLGGGEGADLGVGPLRAVGRADAGDRAHELGAALRREPVAEQVVVDAGLAQHPLVGAAVRRDADVGAALTQGTVDLEHPRRLREEAAVGEQADHPAAGALHARGAAVRASRPCSPPDPGS